MVQVHQMPHVHYVQAPTPATAPIVAMPQSVLAHIDNVVTEMERELSEIRAYEQRQEACEIRQAHLNEIRRLVAERLLHSSEEEEELRQARAEIARLALLEADQSGLKKQALELEMRCTAAEREKEELLRIRSALEVECEQRLSELTNAAEAVESEKRRARAAEESANERVRQAAMEAQRLQEQLLQMETEVERHRRFGSEAVVGQSTAEQDLKLLEGTSRAVLVDCRALQAQIADLEGERREILAREEEHLREIEELRANHEHHHHHVKIHVKKIEDLEQALGEARDQHSEQLGIHVTRISDLENALEDAKSSHGSQLKAQMSELERQAEDWRLQEANHHRQHATNKARIAELEEHFHNSQSADSAHQKQHHVNRTKISELEQQLAEITAAHDSHARRSNQHRSRVSELERELERHIQQDADHQRQHGHNRQKIADYEHRLQEMTSAHDAAMQKNSASRQSMAKLEADMDAMRHAEAHHGRTHGSLQKRVAELEAELNDTHEHHGRRHQESKTKLLGVEAELETHRGESDKMRRRVEELERSHATRLQLEEQVAQLESDLRTERKALATALAELEDCQVNIEEYRTAAEAMERDLQETRRTMEAAMQAQVEEKKVELEQALVTIRDLELQVEQKDARIRELSERIEARDRRRATKASSIAESAPLSARSRGLSQQTMSLVQHSLAVLPGRQYLVGPLLPDSSDDFVRKVQEATRMVGDALKNANEAHVRCISSQLQSALDAQSSGRQIKDGLFDYTHKFEIESERRATADTVEAAVHALRALGEELAVQHQLGRVEREEIDARIKLDMAKCQEELALLRSESALTDLPDSTLQMLVDLQTGSGKDWNDGFTPMHWAAQFGRRDLMEYLLRLEDGNRMLQARDKFGRPPLYYAQRGQKSGLVNWLQAEAGASVPIHSQDMRPRVSMVNVLPDPYRKVLSQIEQHGWRSMNWRDGFTMLHWAANKGHKDICQYLCSLDADPNARDGQGRTALDLARESGSTDIVIALQGFSGRGSFRG